MTGLTRDWLPLEILKSDRVVARLDGAVSEWSTAWFARAQLRATSSRLCLRGGRGDADGSGWRVWRKAVAVSCSPRAADRLADWALDGRFEGKALSHTDQLVVADFVQRIVRDLVLRVEKALDLDGAMRPEADAVVSPFQAGGGLEVLLSDEAGRQCLSLAIPLDAVLPAFKSTLGPPPKPRSTLTPLQLAMAPVSLTVESTLGRAEILVSDLRAMAIGDVLILNTGPDDSVEMAVPGGPVGLRGKLIDSDGDLAISLTVKA